MEWCPNKMFPLCLYSFTLLPCDMFGQSRQKYPGTKGREKGSNQELENSLGLMYICILCFGQFQTPLPFSVDPSRQDGINTCKSINLLGQNVWPASSLFPPPLPPPHISCPLLCLQAPSSPTRLRQGRGRAGSLSQGVVLWFAQGSHPPS